MSTVSQEITAKINVFLCYLTSSNKIYIINNLHLNTGFNPSCLTRKKSEIAFGEMNIKVFIGKKLA